MASICEYCGNSFSSIYILKTHQKNSKYCIDLQMKTNSNANSELCICEFCAGSFASNTISRHLLTCKIKKQLSIEDDKLRIKELENELLKKDISIQALQMEIKNITIPAVSVLP